MPQPFTFARQARNWPTLLAVVGVWLVLLLAWLLLDAALWIIGITGLFTLPAVWDLWRNPASGLSLDTRYLTWHSGKRGVQVALSEIDHVRLDTRLDFTVRATVVLTSGRKLRLPVEATPPHRAFETSLEAHEVKVQRHHFQLMQ